MSKRRKDNSPGLLTVSTNVRPLQNLILDTNSPMFFCNLYLFRCIFGQIKVLKKLKSKKRRVCLVTFQDKRQHKDYKVHCSVTATLVISGTRFLAH